MTRNRSCRRGRRARLTGGAAPSFDAELGHRLGVEPPAFPDALRLLEILERGLRLGADHAVDRTRIVTLVLERLLSGANLLAIAAARRALVRFHHVGLHVRLVGFHGARLLGIRGALRLL